MVRYMGSRFTALRGRLSLTVGAWLAAGGMALAQGVAQTPGVPGITGSEPGTYGAPAAWAIGMQPSGGPVETAIESFNTEVFWIMAAVVVFVAGLLAYAMWRFSAKRHPTPSRTAHHTYLEIAWTVVPVLILVAIAIPSFRLIYYEDRARDADVTINVQGRQWYWHYAYPDRGNFEYDSYPIADDQLRPGQLRNLTVDNELVIPAGHNVRVLTTGQDVIHSFFVPSLGVQRYAIPGRTLETWFRADRPGEYHGQCNQICGTNHWFMPIVVRAVTDEEFAAWTAQARTRFAAGQPPATVAEVRAAMHPVAAATPTMTIAEARR